MTGVSRFRDEQAAPRIPGLRPGTGLVLIGALGLLMLTLVVAELQHRGSVVPMLALVALPLAVLILIRPTIGLFAVAIAAAIVRVKLSTGTDSPIVASLVCACLLCGIWPLHRVLNRRRIILLPPIVAIPALLFMFSTVFSFVWGRATLDPRVDYYPAFLFVQIGAMGLMLVSAGLLFVGADVLRRQHIRTGLMAVIVAVGFAALPFHLVNTSLPLLGKTVFGLFGLWFVAVCWGNAIANRHLVLPVRIVLGCGAIGWLLVQFFLQRTWISGWTPPVIALVLVTLLLRPRLGLILVVVGVLAYVATPSNFLALFHSLVAKKEAQGSIGGEYGRIELWLRNLSVIHGHVLFGTGPAGYALYYVTFIPDQAMSAHSNYIDILSELGIPGILSFLGTLLGLGVAGVRTFRRLVDPADRAACAVVLGGLPAVLYGMALGDWVIPFVYNQTIAGFDHSVYTWLMFAMLCGLIVQQTGPSPEEELAGGA